MNYYIATSTSRIKDHNLVRNSLKKFGHVLSYDWTLPENVKAMSKEHLQTISINEFKGITEADCVIVLLPGGSGTHIELGYAIAIKKKIFLHSEDSTLFELSPQTKPFYHYPELIHLTCPLADVATLVHTSLHIQYGQHQL